MSPAILIRSALASLLFALPLTVGAADVEAWIDKQIQDGVLRATPTVKVSELLTVRYELSAQKTGNAGRSSTQQAGTVAIACCDPVSLAMLHLSVGPSDVYALTLVVYVRDKEAARIEERYPPEKAP